MLPSEGFSFPLALFRGLVAGMRMHVLSPTCQSPTPQSPTHQSPTPQSPASQSLSTIPAPFPPPRYNTLLAGTTGITLSLLPMLAGFFTYKGAVVGRQSVALFNELTAGIKGEEAASGGE
jgi:hypothetical protein